MYKLKEHLVRDWREGWIEGREQEVLEIPQQQIIIVFSHHGNSSARRIQPSGPPSCFFGLPQEYLVFIHELAGVEVEVVEEQETQK